MGEKFSEIVEETEKRARIAHVDNAVLSLCRLLAKMAGCSWAIVYLLDRERREFTQGRSCDFPSARLDLLKDIPLMPGKAPLLKKLLRERGHLLPDEPAGALLFTPLLNRFKEEFNLLVVPMKVNNQMTGAALVARALVQQPFSGSDIGLIQDIVANAALAVSYSTLLDESLDLAVDMGRRLDIIFALDEINKAISSSLSREKIIASAMQNIERLIQCDLVVLFGTENGSLSIMASACFSAELPHELKSGARPELGGSCVDQAYVKGESCYISSLRDLKKLPYLDNLLRETGMQSLIAIPMVSKEKVNGVLLLGDCDTDRFMQDDVFAVEKIAGQIAVALVNANLYEDLENLFIGTVASLANAIDAKSAWTKGHSERVMRVAGDLARALKLDEATIERVKIGGLLHDIGKIGIIEALLEKPEKIAEDDFPPMRLHPEKGVAILAPIEQLKGVLPGILHHHERYDGTGYPDQLKGEAIPLEARIITVADSFDAMVSVRPYKKGYTVEDALQELQRCAGTQFDPVVVACFCDHMKQKLKRL
ncbi:sensor cyclic diguanylate phosphodiesterase, GAF and GAF domain-containing [Geotalea daltonii FRC-32]|uniref:Sensor cyclic diguanylate phosphodiesterase, GAF and GAF domain-containing n=1 Tax=Geotalea daltonii (strain DSM 22248 / JCM 15807 / FRC-32) TaxID=316067 RepID=B9M6K8_GEODF|nr:HD domain-containing phosphohydrolase [Geotalea daltonii]ACM20068.1 sensor cyclic diguanylate phosphodiesterase, GAF and GAF domain-containing [Geotalea daltonii FRC-32]